MNTPTHLLVNATLQRRLPHIPQTPFLLGSVLPDLPLFFLWIGWYVAIRYLQGDPTLTLMDDRLHQLFFTNPVWIVGHNVLHAPLILLTVMMLLWRRRAMAGTWAWRSFWFAAGCLVHTALDIPSHATDGPLLLFPLEWSIRFQSPISYWDPHYYGRLVSIVEVVVDLLLLVYLFRPRLLAVSSTLQRRWRSRGQHG